MKQKTRIIIYIAIAVTALALGIIAVLSIPKETVTETADDFLNAGNKYLIELSYDKAVIEFNKAIEIEPRNADAYIGLAEAYLGMGDKDKAVETLELGYENTGDERIKAKLDELIGEETAVTNIPLFTVPELIGLAEADAVSACETAGITYEITASESETIEKGFVISQSVPAGSEIPQGYRISVKVSSGKPEPKDEFNNTVEVYVLCDQEWYNQNEYESNYVEIYKDDTQYVQAECNEYGSIFINYYKCYPYQYQDVVIDSSYNDISIHGNGEDWYYIVINDGVLDFAIPEISVYDESGNLTRNAENEYDSHNRLVKTTVKDSGSSYYIEYEYDNNGNLISAISSFGYADLYFYDSNNRLIKQIERDNDGNESITYEYSYDSVGNCIKKIWHTDSGDREYDYVYDSNNKLINEKETYSLTSTSGTYEYTYNSQGCLVSYGGGYNYIKNTWEYDYDSSGHISKCTNTSWDGYLVETYYKCNSKGQIIFLEEWHAGDKQYTCRYSYDTDGTLISSTTEWGTGASSETLYKYDSNGRLSEKIYDEKNKTVYTYGEHGKLISIAEQFEDVTYKSCTLKYQKVTLPKIFVEEIKDRYGIDLAA